MTTITNIRQAKRLGDFRSKGAYVGQLVRVAGNAFHIVEVKPFGNGEILWQSAPFADHDFVQTGCFGGIREFTAS